MGLKEKHKKKMEKKKENKSNSNGNKNNNNISMNDNFRVVPSVKNFNFNCSQTQLNENGGKKNMKREVNTETGTVLEVRRCRECNSVMDYYVEKNEDRIDHKDQWLLMCPNAECDYQEVIDMTFWEIYRRLDVPMPARFRPRHCFDCGNIYLMFPEDDGNCIRCGSEHTEEERYCLV